MEKTDPMRAAFEYVSDVGFARLFDRECGRLWALRDIQFPKATPKKPKKGKRGK